MLERSRFTLAHSLTLVVVLLTGANLPAGNPKKEPEEGKAARTDRYGDRLPEGAVGSAGHGSAQTLRGSARGRFFAGRQNAGLRERNGALVGRRHRTTDPGSVRTRMYRP